MKISQASSATAQDLWTSVATQVGGAKTLEEAAQALAAAVHQTFSESVALARVFLTVPYMSLPAGSKEFVQNLAGSANAAKDLKPTTPVLSLVGTRGKQADWNDRRKSKGHAGIPLISAAYVEAIPMISGLLKELGVPLQSIDSQDLEVIKYEVGQSSGLFFVDDADKATDQRGRKIIAAQDFVSGHGIKSVFGVSSAYPFGQIMVLVVFCQESISRDRAEQFLNVVNSFRDATSGLVGSANVFA